MNSNKFIGISVTKNRNPFTFAVLNESLEILAIGDGQIEEVLAYAAGDDTVKVSVNAPSGPNLGLMRQKRFRDRYNIKKDSNRWKNIRVAEFEVFRQRMKGTRTMGTVGQFPKWKRIGYKLYRCLEEIGYAAYPTSDHSKLWLEVCGDVCFHILLGRIPLPSNRLEGMIQRQLLLIELGFDLPDPMASFEEITRYRLLRGIFPFEHLYPIHRQNALVAAYVAFLADSHPDKVVSLGEKEEGLITIPAQPFIMN
ncbi:MAG: hypothetical protein MUO76_06555 [Anaerolineaceae bacterium]|nr:hypothetical protein [Anaerolineaceae bacterium]